MNSEATEKLFYEDPHLVDFSAAVTECVTVKETGVCRVVLDRTAFFPEEGGQKADSGTLSGIPVLDVSIENDRIIHILKAENETAFAPGRTVMGHVNWEQRFDFMQQHTGEHILSGLVHKHFGFRNVGFHLGYEEVTLDFDGVLSWEQLHTLEQKANRAIWADLPVLAGFPDEAALSRLTYRSKTELPGAIRIVEIPGYDICACCAPHTDTTGQIGLLKITGIQSHRGGVRINILCGSRALCDYTQKQDSVSSISVLLSARQDMVTDAVERLKAESAGRKERINALQAELLQAHMAALPAPGQTKDVLLFETGLDTIAIREAVNRLTEIYGGFCCIFAGNDAEGYTYIIGSASGGCRELAVRLGESLQAKGGGSPRMIQGNTAAGRKEIEHFFQQLLGPSGSCCTPLPK